MSWRIERRHRGEWNPGKARHALGLRPGLVGRLFSSLVAGVLGMLIALANQAEPFPHILSIFKSCRKIPLP